MITAYRDVELSEEHALSRLLVDLNRERILRKIVLNRLTTDQVAEVISNHLGGGPVAAEFAKLIYSRTGGNPFFVEEVLRSLSEDSRVFKSAEGWTIREIEQVEIPSTVRSLIRQRVTRLGDNVQILTAASVIGMEFEYELLKRVSGQQEDLLIGELEKAVRAGLVKEKRIGSQVSFVFADEQARDFLYGELSIIRKRKTHAKIGQALEQLHEKSIDHHVEELAYHYVQGGEAGKAVEYSIKAGDRAARIYAHPEAKKHYTNALDLLEEGRLSERLEVLTRIGDSYLLHYTHQECVKYCTEAAGIAVQLKENRALARLYAKMGTKTWYEPALYAQALEYYREGLRVLGEEKDSPEEAAISQEMPDCSSSQVS